MIGVGDLERAAQAFYRRCPTEITPLRNRGVRWKRWNELTKPERFRLIAGIKDALQAIPATAVAQRKRA